ncbi:hypothetical protein ACH5RR_000978 [Cinchona calisaya]|uniref:Pentatricopeptide repeat-containing protein n=1 Tax=Cinchona calisaya TaxID=153742 RepID=A0ABD3B3A1_9GENT
MPLKSPPPTTLANAPKPYFFYGHRKPTQHRPSVRGGLFSNRQTINPNSKIQRPPPSQPPFDLSRWDPDSLPTRPNYTEDDPSEKFFSVAKTLSPIARYIVDSFRKHGQWGPPLVADLNKLRRVTPKLVAEVLKVPHIDSRLSTKFFHWAGKQKGYRHDFSCYNAFAYSLNRTNQFRAADQVPELMDMQGKPPSEKQFEILIRMHSDANRGLRVYYVYEKMKKFGFKPKVFLYNRIMDALVKTNHLDLVMFVYEDFKEDGLVEESITFMILIKGLCKFGRLDEALQLLSRMKENLCKPDVFAYTAIVRVLVGEGNLDGCLRIWEEMQRDEVEPDVIAYGTLVTGLCKKNQIEKAYEFFKEMKEKGYLIDRAIYGSLIEAFVENGKVGSACDLLKDLMDSGYRADLTIYNSLIKGLCSAQRIDRAYKLFQVTIQEDLLPDYSTVKPLLVSFAELKRLDDFCRLLEQMKSLGFSVRDDLSKLFEFMVGKHDKILLALELFEHLKIKKYCNLSIYNILIESLKRIGDVRKALAILDELRSSTFEPDSVTYSIAIQCFVGVGDVHEACTCYNKIKEMSMVPSIAAYHSLGKGLCSIGEIDASMMLIRDCLSNVSSGPLEFKYTLTIIHVCKSNDAQKVIGVIDEMMEQDCSPDNIVYSAIIYGMGKYGTIEEARKVFASIRERKILSEADVIVYDELLIDHMKKKTADLVLSGLKFFGLERKLRAKGSTLVPG